MRGKSEIPSTKFEMVDKLTTLSHVEGQSQKTKIQIDELPLNMLWGI
jgi:hypothetical protein